MADPPFIVAEGSLLSASGLSFIQYYFVILIGFGVENISTGCDISISVPIIRDMNEIPRCILNCCIAWYGIWYHHLSRYIMRYHTGLPQSTRQKQLERKPTTLLRPTFCFGSLSLPSSYLISRLAIFVVLLLPLRWTHHRTDRTTSKHQPWK